MRSRAGILLLAAALLLGILAWLLIQECAFGGGMGGRYRACTCRGVEWVVYDSTAGDGPRRTICFGFVTARTCYRYQHGPEEECPLVAR